MVYSCCDPRWKLEVVRLIVLIIPHQRVVSASGRSEGCTRIRSTSTSSNRKVIKHSRLLVGFCSEIDDAGFGYSIVASAYIELHILHSNRLFTLGVGIVPSI